MRNWPGKRPPKSRATRWNGADAGLRCASSNQGSHSHASRSLAYGPRETQGPGTGLARSPASRPGVTREDGSDPHLPDPSFACLFSGDSFVYYDPDRPPVGPDFYVGAGRDVARKWVAGDEGWLMPTTVIEFLSPSSEIRDRGEKFCLYRRLCSG
ncbi:MAG: Uma2 family endonuclease [Candidatus Eremiobacteraeota bacterium]|nr:Uma2 family endonuclease [Candidatus Eremiobacteraeota bacterium]MCW5870137.1 Uma2 family endonuclease [Candidatus Eremiobacteraeota bacterium]